MSRNRVFEMNLRRLLVFGVAGTIATPAHYITLVLLVEVGKVAPATGTTAGFLVGASVSYLLNRHVTFQSTKATFDTFPKFLSVALATGALNTAIVYLGVDVFDMHYFPVQICATLMVFLINFVLNSAWTFRE